MKLVSSVAPTIEPITLTELKNHLRVDSGTFDGNLTLTQSLAFASHAIAADWVTHVGTGVDVLGKEAVVQLHAGTNGATGTNETRIEESDQLGTGYTEWTGGLFTTVTTANDNADYKIQYTGTKQYIRTSSRVLLAACEFGTSVLVNEATTSEDDDLEDLITDAREAVEHHTRRGLLTQTWDYYLDEFPAKNFIRLPLGKLASVTHIKYTDTDGDQTTMTVTTDYLVETNGDGYGKIVLPYGESWPSASLYPSNPIVIRFICGWTTAASLPGQIRRAVKFVAENLYMHGGSDKTLRDVVDNLLTDWRLWREF